MLDSLEYLMNGSPASNYEKREVNDCGKVNEMAEQYADTIALQKSYGKKQYCNGRQCVAERDQAKRRHEQTGTQNQGTVIEDTGKSIAGQPL